MEFMELALFDGAPHFFNSNGRESFLSPTFKLRAGGRRDANSHFWTAMGDIYVDPDRPASNVIERRGIVDQSQKEELRYCGALIKLRQGSAFEEAIDLHGIGSGSTKDILREESTALNEMKKNSRIFRDAFGAVYTAESVSDVIALSSITDPTQQARLKGHAFMFYIRREMTAFDVIGNYKIGDEKIRRSLFREGCRQKIEEGKSAPEAIRHHRMENEEDKALIRLIGASEDIQEGAAVEEAALRNGVPVDQINQLKRVKREIELWRKSGDLSASNAETSARPGRDGMRSVSNISAPQFQSAGVGRPSRPGGSAIRRLGDHPQSMRNAYVLNDKDELVLESTFEGIGVKRKRETSSEPLSSKDGTQGSPIDLTEGNDVTWAAGRRPAKRMKLDERPRSPGVIVLD